MIGLFILLGFITLSLSIYLGVLYNKIKIKKINDEVIKKQYQEQFIKRRNDLFESLYTLALVMEQGQCSIAEGCIRIKKLIDLDENLRFHKDLAQFHKAYIDFSELAYLDDYKALSNQEKFNQDLKRQSFEAKHEESLISASSELKRIVSVLKTDTKSE